MCIIIYLKYIWIFIQKIYLGFWIELSSFWNEQKKKYVFDIIELKKNNKRINLNGNYSKNSKYYKHFIVYIQNQKVVNLTYLVKF